MKTKSKSDLTKGELIRCAPLTNTTTSAIARSLADFSRLLLSELPNSSKGSLKQLQHSLELLQTTVEASRQEFATRATRLEEQLQRSTAQTAKARKDIGRTLRHLKCRVSTLDHSLCTLQPLAIMLNAQLPKLTERLETLASENSELRSGVAALKLEIQALRQERATDLTERNRMVVEFNSMKAQFEKLCSSLTSSPDSGSW